MKLCPLYYIRTKAESPEFLTSAPPPPLNPHHPTALSLVSIVSQCLLNEVMSERMDGLSSPPLPLLVPSDHSALPFYFIFCIIFSSLQSVLQKSPGTVPTMLSFVKLNAEDCEFLQKLWTVSHDPAAKSAYSSSGDLGLVPSDHIRWLYHYL